MIEKHYLDLLTVDGFIRRYFELACSYPTMQAAYDATERQYELAFGKRKYSDYDTFRNTLSRWNKNKKKA
jgi:hypothetical protein